VNLRLRPDLYEALRFKAFQNYRSMTAEINELLAAVLLKQKETNEAQPASTPSSVSDQ